jgi:hypothetical protein
VVVRCEAGREAPQGYNAQLAVNEQQIALGAEITTESPDFDGCLGQQPLQQQARTAAPRAPRRTPAGQIVYPAQPQ